MWNLNLPELDGYSNKSNLMFHRYVSDYNSARITGGGGERPSWHFHTVSCAKIKKRQSGQGTVIHRIIHFFSIFSYSQIISRELGNGEAGKFVVVNCDDDDYKAHFFFSRVRRVIEEEASSKQKACLYSILHTHRPAWFLFIDVTEKNERRTRSRSLLF